MIPYEELATALDRWRAKNGKPISSAARSDAARATAPAVTPAPAPRLAPAPAVVAAPAPAAVPAVVAAPAAVPAPPVIAAPRPAPPATPASQRSTLFGMVAPVTAHAPAMPAPAAPARPPAETIDESVDDLADSDVVEDAHDLYDNEGNDFALAFAGTPPGAATVDDDAEESTQIGGAPASTAPAMPPAGAPWPESPDDDLP